ncbi:MAG: aminotransferase class I/II-fold pyridoxal phosphate-dependent enzyme [Clostridia bacterium]|nr:aminotransferase class I/II-fold pyridoxal phosphate-dependent enzyme [Clostridia bacterium]
MVTGIKLCLLALTQPGDGVIIQSPVYGPFRFSVAATGRRLMDAALTLREDGGYDMDLDAVEEQLKQGAKAMVLCNPHNPVGRVWTQEELQALIDLLNRYGAYLISDEIHADFVFAPRKFIPALSLQKERVVSLCAASKTFNLAGLQQASLLCCDEGMRKAIEAEKNRAGVTCGNIFALEATRAAYVHGDAWLDGLMTYLDGSRQLLRELVERHLPKAKLSPMEGTYLGWLDCTAYGFTTDELMKKAEEADVVFTGGEFFGEGGQCHLRVNIGAPRRYVEEGILRLAVALEG